MSIQIDSIRAGLLALLLLSITYSKAKGQEANQFSVTFKNPYLISGDGKGSSIHLLEDTLHVFGVIVDSDGLGIGIKLTCDLDGNILDTVRYDSADPGRNVNIDHLYGGVAQIGEHFVMKYAEFYPSSDDASLSVDSLTMIDRNGNILWKQSLDGVEVGPEIIRLRKVKPHPNGGFLINGSIADTSGVLTSLDQVKGLLIRTNAQGEVLWHQRYEGLWRNEDLDVLPDGGAILGSVQRYGQPTSDEHMIVRTDSLGNELWRHNFGGPEGNGGSAICNLALEDGRMLGFDTRYNLFGFGWAQGPFLVNVLEDDGVDDYNVIDNFLIDYRSEDKLIHNAIEDSQGRVIIIGTNSDRNDLEPVYNARRHGYMLALDTNLDSLWSRMYRHYPPNTANIDAGHELNAIVELPDGGFALTGHAQRTIDDPERPGVREIWILRVDSMGCLEPGCHLVSGLQEQHIGLQGSLALYPNPVAAGQPINLRFSPVAGYTMPYTDESTELLLYDGQGRLVYTHVLAPRGSDAGFELALDVPRISAGHYTLQWVSEGRNWYDGVQVVVE